jgi:flagellar motor switch protein FliN/FliY
VAETIEYEQFDQAPQGAAPGADGDLSRLSDVPMELSVEIGRTHMTVGEALDLHPGSVVTLERFAGEPADLLVTGTPIARGEVVVVDEQFGLRVTEILDRGTDQAAPAAEAAADPAAQMPPDAPQEGVADQEA